MANLNLDEILALFENGERRYAEDPAFRSAADSLKMGLGVYAVLDHVMRDAANFRLVVLELGAKGAKENERLSQRVGELNAENEILRNSVASLKEQLHPEPEFGVCHKCGARDETTRVGFTLCLECCQKPSDV